MTFGEAIAQYWQFVVFTLGGVFAFLLGKERNRWKIDEVGKQVERAHSEIDKLEDKIDSIREHAAMNVANLSTSIAQLQTQMQSTHQLLTEMREEMRHKADK